MSELDVVGLRLPDVSWQTHRDLNGLHPSRYPVILQLSRAIDAFEAVALRRIRALVQPLPGDSAAGMIADTTLDFVGVSLFRINRELSNAVTLAQRLRSDATAADRQMAAMVCRINNQLHAAQSASAASELDARDLDARDLDEALLEAFAAGRPSRRAAPRYTLVTPDRTHLIEAAGAP